MESLGGNFLLRGDPAVGFVAPAANRYSMEPPPLPACSFERSGRVLSYQPRPARSSVSKPSRKNTDREGAAAAKTASNAAAAISVRVGLLRPSDCLSTTIV